MRYVDATALLVLCLASSAFGADGGTLTDGPGGPLAVFDAQGKYVGPLVSFEDQPLATMITVNDATVIVPISRASSSSGHLSASSFAWSSSTPFLEYPTADCSGPAIILSTTMTGAGDVAPVRPSITITAGAVSTVYIAPDTYSSTFPNTAQQQVGAPGCIAFPVALPVTGWLPATTYSLNQNHPAPLTIRLDDHRDRR
jgi:hypothetical protein